eukprot:1240413-Alexandrium_andersonii.AAC.1
MDADEWELEQRVAILVHRPPVHLGQHRLHPTRTMPAKVRPRYIPGIRQALATWRVVRRPRHAVLCRQ